jgi:hypothetical protein
MSARATAKKVDKMKAISIGGFRIESNKINGEIRRNATVISEHPSENHPGSLPPILLLSKQLSPAKRIRKNHPPVQ